MKAVNIGLIGLGTVGCGTVTVLRRNADEISRRAGREIKVIQAAVSDLSKPRNCDISDLKLVSDPFLVVNNPDIDVVVELIGGVTLAKELVLCAIENNKAVVTANKALIALHGNEIFAAAQAKGVMVAFEAAVAGGISIIKMIREGLAGNRVNWLAGIINGTSNYILTQMDEPDQQFDHVLKQAQRLGYAEADPAFDIEGIDAAHKLTILASIAFGIPLQFEGVYTEGISQINGEDVEFAQELGYRIKHLGIARRTDAGIELRVHLTLIPKTRLIANVNGVMNAVLIHSDAVGATLHYGAGAGAEPTASAVTADIIDVARVITADPQNRVPHLAFQPNALSDTPLVGIEDVETGFYVRLTLSDESGVLAKITELLGDGGISIEAIIQKPHPENEPTATAVVLTKAVKEGDFKAVLDKITALSSVIGEPVCLRVETLSV